MSAPDFTDREGLLRVLDGPVAELESRLGPPQEAVGRIFSILGPGRAERPAVVSFEVRAPDGVHTHLVPFGPEPPPGEPERSGAGTGGATSVRKPSLSYSVDLVDLLRMACGRLDPGEAFMSGRLRMSGDMTLADTVEAWLTGRP